MVTEIPMDGSSASKSVWEMRGAGLLSESFPEMAPSMDRDVTDRQLQNRAASG
jgi:hypothetical protein